MAIDPPKSQTDVRTSLQNRNGRPARYEKAKDARKVALRLLKYLAPFKIRLAAVIAVVVAGSLIGLLAPWLMGLAIDAIVARGPAKTGTASSIAAIEKIAAIKTLAWISIAMLAAYLASNALSALSNWIMARVSQLALRNMRNDLFARIQTLPMRFFDTSPAGSVMSRLTSDVDAINQAVSQNVTALLTSVITMVGIVIAMFALNHWLAFAALIVIPVMFAFTRFVAKHTRACFKDLQAGLGELYGAVEETVSGQKVIRAFGRNDSAAAAFAARNEEVCRAGVRANSYAMLLMPLTAVLGNFFVIVIAALGGFLSLRGLVSVGTIATFIGYGQNFISPLRQIANLYNSIQAALAGAERVFEILDEPGEADEDHRADEREGKPARGTTGGGTVAFDRVCFSYVPGRPVLRNFSLNVEAGQTIALVGPTGAGKTTVINLLTRFYGLDSGTIAIDGRNIEHLSLAERRGKLGLVLQDTFLFADTVLENIRYGRLGATDEECMAAARTAEADNFIRQLPQGYGTNLAERAGNLSQGQRQLLSIARAVLADPDILILDEATSSVDTRTEARIQKALLALMKGRTSFVIAHRLSTIREADLVVVIENGEIAEKGTHRELISKRGVYYRLYMSQFKGNEI